MAGCTTAPLLEPPALDRAPEAFEVQGRISVRTPEGGDIARLRWTHRSADDEWVVTSPIGNQVGRIESGAWGARLTRADGAPEEAPSFAALAQRLFGAPLEPRALAAWLHGTLPAEGAGEWRVTVEESQRAGDVELARRITATRGEIVVKLVIEQYRALEP
jgi:outer membrane biogenesis lipoprotein LolB